VDEPVDDVCCTLRNEVAVTKSPLASRLYTCLKQRKQRRVTDQSQAAPDRSAEEERPRGPWCKRTLAVRFGRADDPSKNEVRSLSCVL
jgi:hypothetical protein